MLFNHDAVKDLIMEMAKNKGIYTFSLGFASQWPIAMYGKQTTHRYILSLSFVFALSQFGVHWFKNFR